MGKTGIAIVVALVVGFVVSVMAILWREMEEWWGERVARRALTRHAKRERSPRWDR